VMDKDKIKDQIISKMYYTADWVLTGDEEE